MIIVAIMLIFSGMDLGEYLLSANGITSAAQISEDKNRLPMLSVFP